MDLKVYQLDALPQQIDYTCLTEEERSFLPHRQTARAILRHELQKRLLIPAQNIDFSVNEHGKPSTAGQHFNVSHSGQCLCIAFHHLPVGVDVEKIRPRANFTGLAQQFMCREQEEAFKTRNCPMEEFYACWCTAEALVKQAGDTIWAAKKYPFIYRNGKIEFLFKAAPNVLLFSPLPGYCGAVAYQ